MSDTALLYEKIIEYIKDQINSGALAVGDQIPTEMELAKQFNVSRITSKRALEELKNEGLVYRVRGSGSYVAEQALHKDEAHKSSDDNLYKKVISVVIPFADSSEGIMDSISGIANVLRDKEYIMDIRCTGGTAEDEQKVLKQLYDQHVGGIIYYPKSDRCNLEMMNMFYLDNYPFVLIDKYYEGVPISAVVSDNFQGMYDAVKYLLGLGHRKIAFLSDVELESATSVRNRYFGFAKALKEYGIIASPAYVKNTDLNQLEPEAGEAVVKEIMADGVTAVCAVNDYVAMFLIACMKRMGIAVPGQVSVIGFDDLRFGRILDTPLTTVRQDLYQIGKQAGEIVLEAVRGGTCLNVRKVIPAELIVRESCRELQK